MGSNYPYFTNSVGRQGSAGFGFNNENVARCDLLTTANKHVHISLSLLHFFNLVML